MDNRNCKTCNSYAMSQQHDDYIIKTTGHHAACPKFSVELLCDAYEARIDELEKQCAAHQQSAAGHYQAAQTATATLDRLREIVPNDKPLIGWAGKIQSILYPEGRSDG